MMPPKALSARISAETAGVERMPPLPTTIRPKPLAAAILIDDLDRLAVEEAAVAAEHQRLAAESLRANRRSTE